MTDEQILERIEAANRAITAELAAIRERLTPMRAQLDNMPLIRRDISELRRELRMVRSAINNLASEQVTPGEIRALHDDVDKLSDGHVELEHRLATVERRLDERP